jgi:muramoyltetrapeptide carboxypeptidase
MIARADAPWGLRPGDTVAAVLPSGPPDVHNFDAGCEWLRERGFNPSVQPRASARRHRYLAGTHEERLAELAAAYRDPNIRAVYCGRGGYGAMHLLDDFLRVVAQTPPKLLIGFSDVTALGLALWRHKIPWLHAPLLTTIAAEPKETQEHLLAIASGEARRKKLHGTATVRTGKTKGTLIGGSLSLLSALCGTPYFPDLSGAVLFIEDVGERPYRLDRMWMQLVLSGALENVSGVIIGHLTKCDNDDHTGLEVLSELVARVGVPAASGFQFGHEAPNYAVPFGAECSFDADARSVVIESEIVI